MSIDAITARENRLVCQPSVIRQLMIYSSPLFSLIYIQSFKKLNASSYSIFPLFFPRCMLLNHFAATVTCRCHTLQVLEAVNRQMTAQLRVIYRGNDHIHLAKETKALFCGIRVSAVLLRCTVV